MFKLFRFLLIGVFICAAFIFTSAQSAPPPPPISVAASADYQRNEDDGKGSIVRGRAFYQDSNAPVRRGWIGLRKIRELVEKTENQTGGNRAVVVANDYSAAAYVLTNDEGEYIIKSVKAGIYQPIFKVQGILNPSFADRENMLFPQISVDGISEVSADVPARRGGAISGRISYADGEPVIGARVQITRKKEGENETVFRDYGSEDNTTYITDDRGIYRMSGLTAGEYYVRVVEPSVNNGSNASVLSYNTSTFTSNSLLTTFYPNASEIKEAQAISVSLGQEQSDISITISNRRLLKVSGLVVAKNNKLPLKNLQVTFQKITDGYEETPVYYDQSRQTKTDEQGKWAFVDLPKGKYRIRAASPQSYGDSAKTVRQPKFAPAVKEIEIDGENLIDVILEMSTESSISGSVTVEGDKEFPGYFRIVAFNEKDRAESSDSINNYRDRNKQQPNKKTETFRIGELSAGKFTLAVNASDEFYVKSIRLNGMDLSNAPIELGDGAEVGSVQIILSANTGTLKGKITDFVPKEPTFVVLLPVNRSGLNVLTNSTQTTPDKNGEFSVQAAPGEYYVVIGTRSNAPKPGKITEWLADLVTDAPKVTVRENETATITLNAPK